MSKLNKTIRVATDVGGTFTDLVYFEVDPRTGRQSVRTAKSDTTPPDYEQGILNVLKKADVDLSAVTFLAHGTTVVINALTERRGVKTGLITTQGFGDTLEIARANRPDFFNLSWVKPAPFVPRYLRREIPGRLHVDGSEREPLDLSGLPAIVDTFRAEGVEAVAICLLHAYTNPVHEQAVLAGVRRLWPQASAVASHQITREWREYERSSTAVLSAYVQPIAARYLQRLEDGLRSNGYRAPLYVMQSNCGVDTVAHAREIPITMVESGPASGFWGAAELGRLIGEPNVLALDIGGTTAKCTLIKDGQISIKTDYWFERDRTHTGYPIMVPVVDLVEIGNGGGSIAWIDEFDKLHVGPQSAAASPGPAAYGRGGTHVTTTDANLILDRINKDYFCGGTFIADIEAVARAMAPLTERLRLSPQEIARGIIRIANDNMVNALKLVSLSRGHDPRDFTLLAFGGGGAMHAVALAQELGVKKVVIPRGASVFSAWGMTMSDLRRDCFVNRLFEMDRPDAALGAQALLEQLSHDATAQYATEGIGADAIELALYCKIRYQNQEHAVEVPLRQDERVATHWADIVARFHASYEQQYTYRLNAPLEIVGFHIVAVAEIGKLNLADLPVTGATIQVASKGRRTVDYALEGRHEAIVYDAERIEPGMHFAGPAIIEDPGTTIVVHPNNAVSVDRLGNFHITLSV
ncbi:MULTISPECIES: hydantoinase/oxoprolinase family protein [Burkholderiaceae]|uniref:hydantoinase/oxoprolinase family protein n=1 Tax=Burkholderiaceae TaxID=119060 RepID=UPI00095A4FC4|nr:MULTISPECIES: hydantoinase/oxoprolinase family protein [Burkholderiaceae]MCG1040839.1 hydantoinase/oxoprolinase family protein [Mycetohabitans sp. B7]SIT65251.1 N-methylhydantoinase A [Burkholderia sp. b14]